MPYSFFFHQNLLYSLLLTHSLCLYRTFVCVCVCARKGVYISIALKLTHFIILPVSESELRDQSGGSQFRGPVLDRNLRGNRQHPALPASCPTRGAIRSLKIPPIELHLRSAFWWIFFARYFQTSKVVSNTLGFIFYLLKKIIRPQPGIL